MMGSGPGYDGFGVHQTPTESTGGMYTPTTNMDPVLPYDDIEDWEDIIKFPDYDQFSSEDWENAAKEDAARMHLDPSEYVQDMFCTKGLWERLHFLMGFEDACCALMTNPDEVKAIVTAIADHKIRYIEHVAKYYPQIDYFTMQDDYSHKDGLFMDPDTWREIFKPQLKRVVDAAQAYGMTYKHHCCGKMEDLLDDLLEIGITAFDPVQPLNNIPEMMKKTIGKAGICGGLDVQNIVDRMDQGVTEGEVRAEVRRCIDEYGQNGGYMVYGASIFIHQPEHRKPGGNIYIVMDECEKYGKR